MPEPTSAGGQPPAPAQPATLRLAVGLLCGQALAVGAVVLSLSIAALTRPAGVRALVTIAYALLLAGVLGWLGWALARRRGWARGPAIVLQLLLLPIGSAMLTGGLPWLGLPVLVSGLVGAIALLAPGTRAALGLR